MATPKSMLHCDSSPVNQRWKLYRLYYQALKFNRKEKHPKKINTPVQSV